MKKILITGANSYIGTSFEKYMEQFGDEYQIDTVDMIGDGWRSKDFSGYDCVFHVAGIAHSDNGKISKEKEKLYYAVNTDLTVETAKKAKADGVKQFIFMSSAIVYGNSGPIGKGKRITKDTPVHPANCYGDSKVQAENGLRKLGDNSFKVVILRPPMIYGKGSKGNYPLMSKMAQKLPIFPYVKNRRSMLYIENLCEFIRLMIENKEQGTFWPQNKEYSNTSEMVKMIAAAHGKKVRLIKGFTWSLKLLGLFTGLVDKAFGNLYYDKSLSVYKKDYRVCDLSESIKSTEGPEDKSVKTVPEGDDTNGDFDRESYMLNENISLRNYQDKLLGILLYFDEFCRKHGLRYYICGGTCIGAVRHKGFIPWDCDIDVFMPRTDFEKITLLWDKYADTSRYVFDRTDRNNNMRAQLGAIKDVNTTYIRSHNTHYDMNHGIPIDVVVLDRLSDNKFKRKMQVINGMVFSLFNAQRVPNQHGGAAKTLSKIILGVFRSKGLRYRIWRHCEKAMSKYEDQKTEYVGELVTGYHNGNLLYKSEWFDEPKDMLFEGHTVYGPTMPEEYLEMRYPGYMQFPPKEQRVPKFTPAFIDLNKSYKEYKGIEYDDKEEDK